MYKKTRVSSKCFCALRDTFVVPPLLLSKTGELFATNHACTNNAAVYILARVGVWEVWQSIDNLYPPCLEDKALSDIRCYVWRQDPYSLERISFSGENNALFTSHVGFFFYFFPSFLKMSPIQSHQHSLHPRRTWEAIRIIYRKIRQNSLRRSSVGERENMRCCGGRRRRVFGFAANEQNRT